MLWVVSYVLNLRSTDVSTAICFRVSKFHIYSKTHMKYFFLLACFFFITLSVQAQTPGTEETKLSAAICDCLKELNFNTVKTKQQAEAAFADCFAKQSGQLLAVATERRVEITDQSAMQKLGMDVAKNCSLKVANPL